MSNIFFHTDVTLVDGSTLQGDEWPNLPWYPDTPETGVALHDLSWLIKICQGSFQEFKPYRTSRIQVDCTLLTTLSFEGQVTQFHYGVHMSSTPCQKSAVLAPWPLAQVRRWVVLTSKILCLHGLRSYHQPQIVYAHSAISHTTAETHS